MRSRRGWMAVAMVLLAGVGLSGHPAGLGEARLTLGGDGRFDLELVASSDSLLVVLSVSTGRPLPGPLAPGERRRMLTKLAPHLSDRLSLSFDGEKGVVSLESVEDLPEPGAGTPARVIIRFSGLVPPEARRVTWATDVFLGSYRFVVRHAGNESEQEQWLQGAQTSAPVGLDAPHHYDFVVRTLAAVPVGFTHILPYGTDHVLFVVGLCLLSARVRDLLLQVSMFTISHSLTFVLTAYGHLSLPSGLVEPIIALSIAYVAFENLAARRLRTGRLALIAGFGLLHGMGFAGTLADLQLPSQGLAATVAGFNLGVEIGQLTVVGLTVAMVRFVARMGASIAWVVTPASLAIGVTGVYWAVERLV